MSGPGEETTVEDLLAEVTARTERVRILLRQDLLERHRELTDELERRIAESGPESMQAIDTQSAGAELAGEIVALEAEIEAAKREFVFRGIGHRRWADMLRDHPPTKEQKALRLGLDHNPETMPREAIAESCISPKMTLLQVCKFEEVLDERQWMALWGACLAANVSGGDSPKSALAGAIARVSADFGVQPADLEFPAPSSLDE